MSQAELGPIRAESRTTVLQTRSIRYLILCGALLIVAIAVGTTIIVGNYRTRALADNERELKNTALILAEQIDRTFQALDLIQSSVVQKIESLGIASKEDYARQLSSLDVHLMLKDKVSGLTHVDNISLIDSDGNLINFSSGWPIPPITVADRDYFKKLKSDTTLTSAISRPIQGRASKVWTVYFARKVLAPTGEFQGVVTGSIELSYFETLFSSVVLRDNSSITLFRGDAIVLARYPHKEIVLGQIFAPVINLFKTSDSGTIRFNSPFDGTDRLMSVHNIAHYPLFVSATIDTATALADWRNETNLLLGLAALAVLTIALMFFLIVRQVANDNGISQKILALEKHRVDVAINNMPQGLILFDSFERIVVCNKRVLEMYRMSSDVVKPGCAFPKVLEFQKEIASYPRDGAEYHSSLSTSMTQQKLHELQTETSDGRFIQIVSRPVIGGGWVSTYDDVTDQKMREQERDRDRSALRDSEQMAQEIIAGALDGFIQVDERGEVLEWNPRAEEIFGWLREEALGKRVTDLYLPVEYNPHFLEMGARLRAGENSANVGGRSELEAKCKDGRKINVEVAVTAVRRRDGYAFNGFIRDLTEKIAAEVQLRQAQKMESVGQLTGGIAHDFNNMLTVITGTIDILGDAVADKPELAAIAKLISEAADRGAELTGHLLAFARRQPLQPRDTDVNALMVQSKKFLRPTLGEHIEIELQLEEDAWPALVDPSQLTTALLNLGVNARDAMPNGGKLLIETANVILDEEYAKANAEVKAGNYLMIAVSDTGTGMPEAIRLKVFEPFFTTKDVGKGTGLGLSMVYGFLKQSGGHIKIYSEEGYGTTFRIYLPMAASKPELIAQTLGVAQLERGNETILVVEDEALVRASVVSQLQSLGYKTISAANGAEALALANRGDTFDLLFTDVIMPGRMNGRQLADEMAKLRSPLRVLFTSGYTEDAISHHGHLDPGVLLLTKPYRKQDLARMLRRALEIEYERLPASNSSPQIARAI